MSWSWVIIFTFLGTAVYGAISAAPWLPTKKKERDLLVEKLSERNLKVICDLGCGDGRLLFALARKRKDIKLIGYEIFLLPYLIAVIWKFLGGKKYKNVKIIWGDFFRKDISESEVVITFLLDKAYERLKVKFAKELRDETLVIVEAWPMEKIEVDEIWKVEGGLKFNVYKAKKFKN